MTARPSSAGAWSRALELTAPIVRRPDRIFPAVIEELAGTFNEAPALLSDSECLTYRALAERSTRYARWAIEQGVAKGDVVCLLMPNRPEYMAIWLGITRVGGVVALLNTNLAGLSLAHCINVAAPTHLIVAAELVDRVIAAQPHLACAPAIRVHGADDRFPRIDDDIERCPGHPLEEGERRRVTIDDRAGIYTSTTGLPKANVSHAAHAVEPLVCRAPARATGCTLPAMYTAPACSRRARCWPRAVRWCSATGLRAEFWSDAVAGTARRSTSASCAGISCAGAPGRWTTDQICCGGGLRPRLDGCGTLSHSAHPGLPTEGNVCWSTSRHAGRDRADPATLRTVACGARANTTGGGRAGAHARDSACAREWKRAKRFNSADGSIRRWDGG